MTTPQQIRLDPMTEAEYQVYLEREIAHYAAEKVAAGTWPGEDAPALSRAEFARLLPDGLASPGTDLSVARDTGTGERVGTLFIGMREDGGAPQAFIYDIAVEEHQRGKGYGRATMLAAADRARQLGAKSVGLHVFGHNKVALGLYTSLGYATTDLIMSLPL